MSIKESIFNLPITEKLLGVLLESKKSYILINEALKTFNEEDWKNNKQALANYFFHKNFESPNLYDIDYKKFASYFSNKQWDTFLATDNGVMKTKMEPYFLTYLKNNPSERVFLQYARKKDIKSVEQYIELIDSNNIELNQNHWYEHLDIIKSFPFKDKLEFIEKYKIDPLYSKDTFEKLFVNRVSLSSQRKLYEKNRTVWQTNFNSLNKDEFNWFLNIMKESSNQDKATFFNNKLNLENAKVALYKNELLSKRKTLGSNTAVLHDYAYLIAFCNILLNPSNKNYATELAMSLDNFLTSQMKDSTTSWWRKVQFVIDNEDTRHLLDTSVKSEWVVIYEKIYLDESIAKVQNARPRTHKL